MQIGVITPVLIALVFGLVVSAIELVIAGQTPLPPRTWLARAWLYACFCYVILFGVIKV